MIWLEDAPVALKIAKALILSRRLLRFEFIIPRTALRDTTIVMSVAIVSRDAKIGEIFDGASLVLKASALGRRVWIWSMIVFVLRESLAVTTIIDVKFANPNSFWATTCGMITGSQSRYWFRRPRKCCKGS